MKVMHLIGGKEIGGSKSHLLPFLQEINSEKDISLCVFEWGVLAEEAAASNIQVTCLQQSSRYDLKVLQQLARLVKKIDILHTHGPRANLYAFFLKKWMSFRWCATVHSDPWLDFMDRGLKGRLFTRLHLHALKKVDHCFAISKKNAGKLTILGIDHGKITTAFNGISFVKQINDTKNKRSPKINKKPFIILNVGRLHPVKGHKCLIHAFHKLIGRTDMNLELHLVGGGEIEDELREHVDRLGLSDHVRFFGFHSDVMPFYERANLYVQSSISEGFSIALLEASRAGLPIISTDVGGADEMIKDNRHGWIVPPGDDHALAGAMAEAVVLDEKKLKEKAHRLYFHVSQHFSMDRLAQVILSEYQKMNETKDNIRHQRSKWAGLFNKS